MEKALLKCCECGENLGYRIGDLVDEIPNVTTLVKYNNDSGFTVDGLWCENCCGGVDEFPDEEHLGCRNWPNCDTEGCGVW